MAFVLYAPWVHGEWFAMACAIGIGVLVIQSQGISKTRVLWTTAVMVAAIGACALLAADGDVVVNACSNWERYSAEWWAAGCWFLDWIG